MRARQAASAPVVFEMQMLGCAPSMPEAIRKTIEILHTVRGIETDASSSVSPGWIARMLEAARWSAFGLDGFVLRDQVVGGVARAAAFEFFAPLHFEDQIEIKTWLARVGNTSYDFGHAIRKTRDDVEAVRARVTVVHLGPDGPAPLEAELRTAVLDAPVPNRVVWPETERRESWDRDWIVRPSDQDSFQHVNQARYVDYIDDTRQLAAMSGREAGLVGPLGALSVEYLRETHAGEHVRMQTWIAGDAARAFELTNVRTGEVHSRGQVRGAPTAPASEAGASR